MNSRHYGFTFDSVPDDEGREQRHCKCTRILVNLALFCKIRAALLFIVNYLK